MTGSSAFSGYGSGGKLKTVDATMIDTPVRGWKGIDEDTVARDEPRQAASAFRRRMRPTIGSRETIERYKMKNPLESIWGTIICGLILTVILYWAARALLH